MRTLEQYWEAYRSLREEAKESVRAILRPRNIGRLDTQAYRQDYDLNLPWVETFVDKYGCGHSLVPSSLIVWDDGNVTLHLRDDESDEDYDKEDLDDVTDLSAVLGILEMVQDILELVDSGQAPLLTGEGSVAA